MPGTLFWIVLLVGPKEAVSQPELNIVAGSVPVVLMNTRGPLATII